MNKWEVGLLQWLIEQLCPKRPKPKPYIEFDVGPVTLKNPKLAGR
jgi:hypothetical protein